MNRAILWVLMFAVFVVAGPLSGQAVPPNTPASTNSIDPALCSSLVKHTPDANVAYQPGVDVNGNAVAPADLPNSPQIQMPKTITFPITVQLANVIHLNTSQYPFNQLGNSTEGQIGVLTVTGDHVLFNGQPISDEQQDNLAVLCMKANK